MSRQVFVDVRKSLITSTISYLLPFIANVDFNLITHMSGHFPEAPMSMWFGRFPLYNRING